MAKTEADVENYTLPPCFEDNQDTFKRRVERIRKMYRVLSPEGVLILAFIRDEELSNRAVFFNHIRDWFNISKRKLCDMLKEFKTLNLITIERECLNPKCGKVFERIPERCPACNWILIPQGLHEKDARKLPRYLIRITREGEEYMQSYLKSIGDYYNRLNVLMS